MSKRNLIIGGVLLGSVFLGILRCRKALRRIVPVRPFQPEKFMGTWFEIARLDHHFEHGLSDVTAHYSLNIDGSIKVINRGYNNKTRREQVAKGKAKVMGTPDEARLKVSFFGPFYQPYNIVALDAGYKYALVAGKNLRYLWLLSRSPDIPEQVKQEYLKQAESLGYDLSALVWVNQRPGHS